MRRALVSAIVQCSIALCCIAAWADGWEDLGADLHNRVETWVRLRGNLRWRGEGLHNLDLDRGPDASGRAIFPVPASDPRAQWLSHADMRLRSDVAIFAPGGNVVVKARLDALDNLSLGSAPRGAPLATTTQAPPATSITLKRAWAEAMTPLGVLAAGRMGSHWGMGLLAHGGDCLTCDSGDAADRVAFVMPVLGHVIGIAYDFSATGPMTKRADGTRALDLDPADDVRTVTVALLNYKTKLARDRRARAGKVSLEYGAFVSHRRQSKDLPASYLPIATPMRLDPAQVVLRDFRATALDAWLRLTLPRFRLEAEGVYMTGEVGQATLLPGALLRGSVRSQQSGAAMQSEWGAPDEGPGLGLDGGYASGDPAPGFGANQPLLGRAPRRGALDGAQSNPPADMRIDNLRFHPDFHIDRILWREIVGTVTDAVYLRPHVRWRFPQFGAGTLTVSVAAIASWAIEPASTPGSACALGVEIDPTLTYVSKDGFIVALEHAVLLPGAGLDNPQLGLQARAAQLIRARLHWVF